MVLVHSVTRAGDSVIARRRSPESAVGAAVTPSPSPADRATTRPRAETPRLAKFHVPEILFGPGSLSEAAHAAVRLGARRPLLVTDPGLLRGRLARTSCSAHLAEAGLRPRCGTGVTPNPKDHEIAAGHVALPARQSCDVIIALGGGSVIDAAKGIALLAGNGGTILDYEGVDRMALPDPADGHGAVHLGHRRRRLAVLHRHRHRRATPRSRSWVARWCRTCRSSTRTCSPRCPTGSTPPPGLDALTHGIEAYVSRAHNPLTDHHALQAIALVGEHLERTMDHPGERGRAHLHGAGRARGRAGVHQRDPRRGARHEPPGRRPARPAARRHQRGAAAARHPVQRRGRPAPLRPDRPGAGPARHHRAGLRRRGRRGRRVGGARGPQARPTSSACPRGSPRSASRESDIAACSRR